MCFYKSLTKACIMISAVVVIVIFSTLFDQCHSCCPAWKKKQRILDEYTAKMNRAVCGPEIRQYKYQGEKTNLCWTKGGDAAKWLCANRCKTKCNTPAGTRIGCGAKCRKNKIFCNCRRGCLPETDLNSAMKLFNEMCIQQRPGNAPKPTKPPATTTPPTTTTTTTRIPATTTTTTTSSAANVLKVGGIKQKEEQIHSYEPDPMVDQDVKDVRDRIEKMDEMIKQLTKQIEKQ